MEHSNHQAMIVTTQYQQQPSNSRTWSIDLLFLTLSIGLFFFILAGTRPLFVPDEGRYAEIAREMITRHDYVTPYLNGMIYFEKPALFYWLEAAAIKLGGLSLWSLRSVNVLLGLLGCLMTYAVARLLYDRITGLLAAFVLATATLYFVMTHMISLDLPVTVFIAATLYAFLLGTLYRRNSLFYLAALCAALAVLTKGLIGVVLPGGIIGLWIIMTRQWSLLRSLPVITCLLIFILVAAPWHVMVNQRHPAFFNFYFIEQHFLRYTTKEVGHYQPVWFFLPHLILGFFPWIIFLPQAIVHLFQEHKRDSDTRRAGFYFLIWAGLIFVFFSFSKSKLIPYILPIFPALAIMIAHYLRNMCKRNKSTFGFKAGYMTLIGLACLIAYVLIRFSHSPTLPDPLLARYWLSIATTLLIVSSLTAALLAIRHAQKALIVTLLGTALFLLSMLAALPAIDTRTILPLSLLIKQTIQPGDTVITYNQYYQDLPFYLERQVSILNWRNELTFGMTHQAQHDWLLDDAGFWALWHSKKRVYVIMSKEAFGQFKDIKNVAPYHVLGKTMTNILLINK